MTKLSATINEAVAMTGISRSSLYKLLAAGTVPKRKSGKRTLILVSDLENYLTSLPAAQ
ncbi:helix-turn-helix domain-containing protein [Mesorhizobium sp. M0898]|uniref:helix-turn-helix transcriptional regulator n=1 Tax=Mesorhizobium sp. M0898 TaxID=2957020 RepID=UPI00333D2B8B